MNKNNPQSELAMLRDPSSKKSKKDIKVSKITIAKLKDPSDKLSNIDVKGKKGGGLMSAINRVKKEQGVKGMMRGGLSGGNPSGPPRRMVPDPALITPLNPGKLMDVTEMAKGGFMDEEIEKRMMGGYMEYKEDK
jgi:hypothetical protein